MQLQSNFPLPWIHVGVFCSCSKGRQMTWTTQNFAFNIWTICCVKYWMLLSTQEIEQQVDGGGCRLDCCWEPLDKLTTPDMLEYSLSSHNKHVRHLIIRLLWLLKFIMTWKPNASPSFHHDLEGGGGGERVATPLQRWYAFFKDFKHNSNIIT